MTMLGRLRTNRIRTGLVAATTLLTVFSGTFHIVVLSILRANIVAGTSSKLFLASLFVTVAVLFIGLLSNHRDRFQLNVIVVLLCAYVMLACLLLFTGLGHYERNPQFDSEVQAYLILMLCSIMSVSLLVAGGDSAQELIYKMVPGLIVIYTLGTVVSLVFSSGLTTGGLMSDRSGLNYQSNSYCAAYAIGLTLYSMGDLVPAGKDASVFRPLMPRPISFLLLCIQFSVLVLSGGRGGLVTAFFLVLFWLYTQRAIIKTNIRLVFAGIIGVAVFILIVFSFLGNSNLEYSGLDRLVSFLDGGGDSNRSILRTQALNLIAQKPLFGYGAGSIFFLLNTYSHNIFTDIAVEYGLVGLGIFLLIMFYGLAAMGRLIKRDKREYFWAYIFIMGMSMLLFSSYYLVSVMCVFPVAYCFVKDSQRPVRADFGCSMRRGIATK